MSLVNMTKTCTSTDSLSALFQFIPLLEEGAFKSALSVYISTGEHLPAMHDLKAKLCEADLALPDFNWLQWVDQAQPYLQNPTTLSTASLDDLRRLTTIAVNADVLNASLFPHLCSSGFMQHLLIRLRIIKNV